MQQRSNTGSANIFVLLFIISVVFLVGIGSFAVWAFISQQDYKNNTDNKVAVAVRASEEAQKVKLAAEFSEKEKSPFKTYSSSATYGSINFNYPKTWSVYIDETNSSVPIAGYFQPNFVPAIRQDATYALRLQLLSSAYDQEVKHFEGQIKSGSLHAVAYIPVKLKGQPNVQAGVKLEGELSPKKPGIMVILKVRDKTLKISTDGSDTIADFNNTILPSLSFAP